MSNKRLFNVVYLLISAMAILRYGQGSDYFNYLSIYDSVKYMWETEPILMFVMSDPGYALLNWIAIVCGIPFTFFMAIITAGIMYFFYVFLTRTCNYSFKALFVFFCVIYMIYALSIMRQGICISIFYAYMYPMLKSRKIKKYLLLNSLLISVHASSIIFVLLPFVKFRYSDRTFLCVFIVSLFILVTRVVFISKIPIDFIQERVARYVSEPSSNQILAKIVRCLVVIPLFFIPKKMLIDSELAYCCNLLLVGFVVYSLTSFSELTCSRLWGYFWGFECVLLSRLDLQPFFHNYKVKMVTFCILLFSVMWVKDLRAAINQGEYKNCTMFSYPYISVFDTQERLLYYRKNLGFFDT